MQTPQNRETLYDVAWRTGGDYAVLVGYSFPTGGNRAISYRLFQNEDVFRDRKELNPGTFLGIDWRPAPAGDYALVVGRRSNSEFAVWYTHEGTAFHDAFFKYPGGNLRDVSWNASGDYAVVTGYYTDTGGNPIDGALYRFNDGSLDSPVDLSPSWLNRPLYTVACAHHSSLAVIGGSDTLMYYDGGKVGVIENNTGFTCYDAAFSPDDRYLLMAGWVGSNNSGIAVAIDLQNNITYVKYTTGSSNNGLYGVSWKSTGNFAMISGENGQLLEFSENAFTTYNSGTNRILRRQCWMDPSFSPASARYEFNLIVGGSDGSSGARVIKYRQNDVSVDPPASDDSKADAPDVSSPPLTIIGPSANYRGYLDTKDAADCYQIDIPYYTIMRVEMTPYKTADYGIRLYKFPGTLVDTVNTAGPGGKEVLFYDRGALIGGTYYVEFYRVSGNGTYNFRIDFYPDTQPFIEINRPLGGERWTGGISHTIKLTIVGGTSPYLVTVNYSTDGGATYPYNIVLDQIHSGPNVDITWAVPSIDTKQARLYVYVTDNGGPPQSASTESADNFAIDSTDPYVTGTVPVNNSADVPVDQTIFVQFSEPMNISVAPEKVISLSPPVPGVRWKWNATSDGLVGVNTSMLQGTKYTITVNKTAGDTSDPGNFMNYTYVGTFTTWYPKVFLASIISPNGYENWTVGNHYNITWNATGGFLPYNVKLDYSVDYGSTWVTINEFGQNSEGVRNYPWTVPDIPTSYECLMKVSVNDSSPMPIIVMDASDSNFTIYKPPITVNPYIVSTNPADLEANVEITRKVAVIFSRAMNTGTVAYTCTPTVGNWVPAWNNGNKTLNLTHDDFAYSTAYKFNITKGEDTDGNPLVPSPTVPNPWKFTTQAPQPPRITATSPANGDMSVALKADVVVTFNNPMDTTTIKSSCNPDPSPVGWTVVWSNGDRTATFKHPNDFQNYTHYGFNITAGKDKLGKLLVPGSIPNPWSFTTVSGEQLGWVLISPYPSIAMSIGGSQIFDAQAYTSNGTKLDAGVNYTWTITGTPHGSISPLYGQHTYFDSLSAGTCSVQVTAKHSTGTRTNVTAITISTTPPELDSVAIDPPGKTLNSGDVCQFTAKAYNGSNLLANASFSWSVSNTQMGTLSGVSSPVATFTAVSRGTGELRANATYNGKTMNATADVSVLQPVLRIELSPKSPLPLHWLETQLFSVIAFDSKNKTIPGNEVNFTWAVNHISGNIGKFDGKFDAFYGSSARLLTAKAMGTGNVTVIADGTVKATANVIVLNDTPPTIILVTKASTWGASTDLPIEANVTDAPPGKVAKVELYYSNDGKNTWIMEKMDRKGVNNYTYIVPKKNVTGDIFFYIRATDDMNLTSYSGSQTLPYKVTITGVVVPQEEELPWWLIWALLIVAIMLAMIIVLVAWKRKRESDDAKKPHKVMARDEKMPVPVTKTDKDIQVLQDFLRGAPPAVPPPSAKLSAPPSAKPSPPPLTGMAHESQKEESRFAKPTAQPMPPQAQEAPSAAPDAASASSATPAASAAVASATLAASAATTAPATTAQLESQPAPAVPPPAAQTPTVTPVPPSPVSQETPPKPVEPEPTEPEPKTAVEEPHVETEGEVVQPGPTESATLPAEPSQEVEKPAEQPKLVEAEPTPAESAIAPSEKPTETPSVQPEQPETVKPEAVVPESGVKPEQTPKPEVQAKVPEAKPAGAAKTVSEPAPSARTTTAVPAAAAAAGAPPRKKKKKKGPVA
jgi:hypothetical protein